MSTVTPHMRKSTLAAIDKDGHGLISKRTAELDGVSVTEVTFDVGAVWSKDLKSYAGTDLCELPHVAVVARGALTVQMAEGETETFAAGDVVLLPPGHDACVPVTRPAPSSSSPAATTTTPDRPGERS